MSTDQDNPGTGTDTSGDEGQDTPSNAPNQIAAASPVIIGSSGEDSGGNRETQQHRNLKSPAQQVAAVGDSPRDTSQLQHRQDAHLNTSQPW